MIAMYVLINENTFAQTTDSIRHTTYSAALEVGGTGLVGAGIFQVNLPVFSEKYIGIGLGFGGYSFVEEDALFLLANAVYGLQWGMHGAEFGFSCGLEKNHGLNYGNLIAAYTLSLPNHLQFKFRVTPIIPIYYAPSADMYTFMIPWAGVSAGFWF